MIRAIFIGAAAVLALAPSAFAQSAGASAGAAGASSTTAPVSPSMPAGPATGVMPSVTGATPPGVAGGVQPYQPAGFPGSNTGVGGVAGPTDSSLTGGINATLQAGQIAGSDSASVGAASAMPGQRTPSSTGAYGGLPNPTYGAPGATPYTGPAGVPRP